jgi:hypothetical protein
MHRRYSFRKAKAQRHEDVYEDEGRSSCGLDFSIIQESVREFPGFRYVIWYTVTNVSEKLCSFIFMDSIPMNIVE